MLFFKKLLRNRHVRRPTAGSARPAREPPYAVSSNAWLHPELITIGFVPDNTPVTSNGERFDASAGRLRFSGSILPPHPGAR